jgi:hypothetical protein
MNSVSQYRNIRPGSSTGVSVVTAAVGSSPADPPNSFSNNDIQDLISNLFNAGRVPSPASDAQIFYCVIVPPGVSTRLVITLVFLPFQNGCVDRRSGRSDQPAAVLARERFAP